MKIVKIWRNGNDHFKIKQDYSGDMYYLKNNKLHRDNKPAIEYSNGDKHWYQNNLRHRIVKPAIEYSNGDKYWYIYDIPCENQLHQILIMLKYKNNA